MGGIINLKKRSMVFEREGTQVIIPLDPIEGETYTKLSRLEDGMDHIYKIIAKDENWINPMVHGMPCWEKDTECVSDSDKELEDWKNRLQEISTLRCLQITREFWYMSFEVRELRLFDGSSNIKEFF